MVNVNKLKGAIIEHGFTVDKLAAAMSINPSSFYRKLKTDGATFSIGEADSITKILNLSCEEATAIFFAQYVA